MKRMSFLSLSGRGGNAAGVRRIARSVTANRTAPHAQHASQPQRSQRLHSATVPLGTPNLPPSDVLPLRGRFDWLPRRTCVPYKSTRAGLETVVARRKGSAIPVRNSAISLFHWTPAQNRSNIGSPGKWTNLPRCSMRDRRTTDFALICAGSPASLAAPKPCDPVPDRVHREAGNAGVGCSGPRRKSVKSAALPLTESSIVAAVAAKHSAWSAHELAELLGCSGKHIYALAKSGRLPHLRINGMIRFDPAATAQWLRERFIAA